MSKPSFSNIDLWLFELAEGNLNELQKEQLRIFLLQHPELDVEKDAWEWAHVDQVDVVFPDQELLIKKSPARKVLMYSSAAMLLLLFVGCYQILMRHDISRSNYINGNGMSTHGDGDLSEQNDASLIHRNTTQGNSGFISSENDGVLSNEDLVNSWFSMQENTSLERLMQDRSPMLGDNSTQNLNLTSQSIDANFSNNSSSTHQAVQIYKNLVPKDIKGVMNAYQYEKRSHNRGNFQYTNRASGYDRQASFAQKFKKAARKIKRMLDNPIALSNYRDPHYHLPGTLNNDVNFSSSGTLIKTRVQTMSRLQWFGQENQQLMNSVAVDGYSYGIRGGWGIQLNHGYYDNGKLNVSSAAFTYSPKFSVNSVISIEPSVRFKLGYKLVDTDAMSGVNQIEVDRGNVMAYYPNGGVPVGNSIWYKDLGTGLMINTEWFFIGVQADNLFKHREMMYDNDISNQNRASAEIFASAGTDWESRSKKMTLSPYAVYHHNQNLSEMWLGMNYKVRRNVMKNNYFTVGAAVSSSLEPAASLGMKFDRFSLIYNADYSQSRMTNDRSLSHQLVLRFISDRPKHLGRNLLNRGI